MHCIPSKHLHNIYTTSAQRVFDVGPILYTCNANVLCLLGNSKDGNRETFRYRGLTSDIYYIGDNDIGLLVQQTCTARQRHSGPLII